MTEDANQSFMTFGEHMEALRRMLFRIISVVVIIAIVAYCCKEAVWNMLLAPSECDFATYTIIEEIANSCGMNLHFEEFHVELIATDLSSQFMKHITTSVYLGLLGASPYILYELFRFVSPALYDNEKRHSFLVVSIIYVLFVFGVFMSYYIIFPISFRFLGTYNVSEKVHSTITLDSYIDTFASLTFIMGLIFQLPVIMSVLTKIGFISYRLLAKYRRHALIIIMIVAAIITPPDLMTLILVTIPLYLLYEISIMVTKYIEISNQRPSIQ